MNYCFLFTKRTVFVNRQPLGYALLVIYMISADNLDAIVIFVNVSAYWTNIVFTVSFRFFCKFRVLKLRYFSDHFTAISSAISHMKLGF